MCDKVRYVGLDIVPVILRSMFMVLFIHVWIHWILYSLSHVLSILQKGYMVIKLEILITSWSKKWIITKFVVYIYKIMKVCGILMVVTTYRIWKWVVHTKWTLHKILLVHVIVIYEHTGILFSIKWISGIKANALLKVIYFNYTL